MSEVRLPAPLKASVDPKLLDQIWEAGHRFAAGVYAFDPDGGGLWFACPCGCGDVRRIPINGSNGWTWDGNRETPTLSPSILMHANHKQSPDGGTHWHGYLQAGMWVQA